MVRKKLGRGRKNRCRFCTKDGCGWWWNGIGRLEPVKAEHEALNDTDPAAEPEMAANHVF